ncbi:probable protein phosphatase 2C 20 isoform X2 [Leguminivora glycinivorella]|uniref:probable protein phosphatase 2C 20 isoform X2 n=1 Tax=Leguminivora glycinivorella TaxID=1035111 RepID=UPI00200CFE71|nr:probable protein phosphatase 2C 20 isoform X2 [Leguminivora glycinivorella]
MPASIGVNLRVTGHCSQGGRKYMEDLFSVAYQQTEDERDLEYAFFGIYDGHGGSEAAAFAKEHLMDSIVKQRQFWSDNDEDVLKAIRNGYMLTHLNMWKELEKWPKTVTGLPSTAGTTASVAFIRRGKIYIGHVGDSAIVLGYQKEGSEEWAAKPLTSDHKPESTAEMERIQRCGGKVVSKAGVPRVVWNRPRQGHKGPIKKNTPMDEIPFLAVARSLGDLWSYNTQNDEFIVSPDPDVGVLTIDPTKFRCLIFGTDGLWNMISPEGAVSLVQATERHNEAALVGGSANQPRDWLNPSKSLVDHALERWSNTRMRADNTSVVTLMLDPPGPPRATVLRARSKPAPSAAPAPVPPPDEPDTRAVPQNGLTIMTRYSDVDSNKPATPETTESRTPLPPCATLDGRFSTGSDERGDKREPDTDAMANYGNPAESYFMARLLQRSRLVNTLSAVTEELAGDRSGEPEPEPATVLPEPELDKTLPADVPAEPPEPAPAPGEHGADDVRIQINEVSSSSPTEGPPRPRGRRLKPDARPPAPDRVLRSHDADSAPRPHTRRGASRAPPPTPTASSSSAAAPARARAAARPRAAAQAAQRARAARHALRRARLHPRRHQGGRPGAPRRRVPGGKLGAAGPGGAAARAHPAHAPGAAPAPAPARQLQGEPRAPAARPRRRARLAPLTAHRG